MSVYVDELQPTRSSVTRQRKWRYRQYCHMMAESDKELEEMARCLQLPRRWRHGGDHYDLTRNKRQIAIKLGAIAISTRKMVRIRQERRSR